MKIYMLLLVLAIFSITVISCNNVIAKKEVSGLTIPEAKTMFTEEPDVIILDVRTPDEFQKGHIDGAILINFFDDNFEGQVSKLDRSKPVVIYCRSGNRSEKAGIILTGLGFSEIYDIEEGYIGWN